MCKYDQIWVYISDIVCPNQETKLFLQLGYTTGPQFAQRPEKERKKASLSMMLKPVNSVSRSPWHCPWSSLSPSLPCISCLNQQLLTHRPQRIEASDKKSSLALHSGKRLASAVPRGWKWVSWRRALCAEACTLCVSHSRARWWLHAPVSRMCAAV